ncbi:MAG: ATP-binding protein, partial [Actinomycetes bacterium]
LVDDALLVVSELVANAVRHGRPLWAPPPGRILLRWELGPGPRGPILVEVVDGGGVPPVPADADLGAVRGRGLVIVGGLARVWGYDVALRETRVWALLGR